jgi:ABC-type phosphate/phosphonate transport system ATPase subunit
MMSIELSPAQHKALTQLRHALPIGHVLVLYGDTGQGKTTVLRELHREIGGTILTASDFIQAMQPQHPQAMEETLSQMLMAAWGKEDNLFFDDLDMIYNVLCSCGFNRFYPRAGLVESPLKMLAVYAGAAGKKLIISTENSLAPSVTERS